jgi:hypothetical protein
MVHLVFLVHLITPASRLVNYDHSVLVKCSIILVCVGMVVYLGLTFQLILLAILSTTFRLNDLIAIGHLLHYSN